MRLRLDLMSLLLGVACSTPSVDSGAAAGSSSALATGGLSSPPLAAESAVPPPYPSESVYFAVPEVGTFLLDDTGPRLLRPTKRHVMWGRLLGSELWVSEIAGSYRIVGSEVFPFPDSEETFKGIGGKLGGELWAAESFRVAQLEGGKWKSRAEPVPGDSFIDLTVDQDGTGWVLSFSKLFRRAPGESWKLHRELGKDAKSADRRYVALGVAGGQLRYLLANDQLLIRRGEDFALLSAPLPGEAMKLSVSPTGKAVVHHLKGVSLIDEGGATRLIDLKALGLDHHHVRSAGADARDRIWLATEYGLVVLDKDNKVEAAYPPGTMPGVDNAVTNVWPVGAGPSRFAPPEKPRTATLRARVYLKGVGVPNAKIELCTSPDLGDDVKSPCAGEPYVRAAVSGSGGEFELTEVPIGKFSVAFQEPGSTRWRFGPDCCRLAVDGVFSMNAIHPPE